MVYANILVTVDVLGFPRSMHDNIRAAVMKLSGEMGASWRIGRDSDFILCATHTHNGPVLRDSPSPKIMYDVDDPAVERYSKELEKTIVGVIRKALSQEPLDCVLEYAVGSNTMSAEGA